MPQSARCVHHHNRLTYGDFCAILSAKDHQGTLSFSTLIFPNMNGSCNMLKKQILKTGLHILSETDISILLTRNIIKDWIDEIFF